jgi:hypothetical protein
VKEKGMALVKVIFLDEVDMREESLVNTKQR